MRDYNKVFLMGRLTSDLELKFSTGGQAVCEGGIAVNRKYKDNEETLFMDFTAWGRNAEVLCEYCKKGSRVFLTGRLKQDTWEKEGKKYSKVYLVVEEINMLDKKE